jgi:hypothetical protein
MKVQIEFNIDNAAFDLDDSEARDPRAIASILNSLANRFEFECGPIHEESFVQFTIRDYNGNKIGQAKTEGY